MFNNIPQYPNQNPCIADGAYDAIIKQLDHGTYAEDGQFVRVLFWLPDQGSHICTCFYFPRGFSIRSQQRLWYLCQSVGLEQHDIEHPEKFEGKKLRIKVYRVAVESSSDGQWYSDVEMFLPSAVFAPAAREVQAEQLPF